MPSVPTVHMAGDQDGLDNLEIYRAWMVEHPECQWTRVLISRFNGMYLIDDRDEENVVSLYFRHGVCGYTGTSSRTTIDVLVEAGFGEPEELRRIVVNQSEVRLEMSQL